MLFCALVISGCEKDEAPLKPFLTIDLTRADEGRWIFATNEKGELLDIVRADLTNRVVKEMKTNKQFSSVDLTYLSIYREELTGNVYGYGTTYRNIPTTMTIDAGYPPGPAGSPTFLGTKSITVNNYTGSRDDVNVTTQRGTILPDQLTVTGQQIHGTIDVFDNSNYIIISAKRDGNPVYYRAPLQGAVTALNVDFSAFVPMENIVALTEVESVSVSGLTASGYRTPVNFLLKNNYVESTNPVRIGTVPGFDRYLSTIRKTGQAYLKVGPPIAPATNVEQKFINYTLNVTDSNIKSFSFNFSDSYDYKYAFPYGEIGPVTLSWGIYASANDEARMLFDIPNIIFSEYPELANYSFSDQGSVTLFKSLNNTYTYSDFLNEQLQFNYKDEFEQLIIIR